MSDASEPRWRRRLRRAILIAVTVVVSAPVLVALIFAAQARVRLADLRPWHRVRLASEFHAGRAGAPKTFEEYLKLEDRLVAELHARILDDPAAADRYAIGRYNPASVPARLAWGTPYNRSFELAPEHPRGAALLVHGLSDGPYSMRAIAEQLRDAGFYVLVLRLPGHGTIPSGLIDARWQDWEAAVELAARHAAQHSAGGPFYAGGYSTGAALTTLYSVRALADPGLPKPARLILSSPAIGISKAAALTKILAALSFIPYFEKSNWIDVEAEYDPYKYNSFPVNAAQQIHALTVELQDELDTAAGAGRLSGMPRILAFQSLVDATITAREVVDGLLRRFPARGDELVVFDVNRSESLRDLIEPVLAEQGERLRSGPALPFRLTVVGNRDPSTVDVAAFTREAGTSESVRADLPLRWPKGVLSLGHVALPFAVDDPVYGLTPKAEDGPSFPLGALTIRGEAGTLVVPLGNLARLRSNPFFAVVREKIDAVVAADRSE
jgi:alpha-beta hydrolase superfamily lysophospholipase